MMSSLPCVVDGDAVHSKRSCVVVGDLLLPGGVDDAPRVVRMRLTGKMPPVHMRVREASPPPKRRKRLSLPGPSVGCQENSYFPRVGVG